MLKPAPKPAYQKRLTKRTAPMEAVPLEETDQITVAQWLDLHNVLWCHVPNGGYRHAVTANRFKAQGVKPGVPDCLIFSRPPAYGNSYVGVALELKRKKGGVVSALQVEFMERMKRNGWLCVVARGADEAIEILDACGYGRVSR